MKRMFPTLLAEHTQVVKLSRKPQALFIILSGVLFGFAVIVLRLSAFLSFPTLCK